MDDVNTSPRSWPWTSLKVLGALAALALLFSNGIGAESFAIQRGESSMRISDFAYYLAAARAVLLGEVQNIYGYPDQVAVLSQIYGGPLKTANPLGLTPTFPLLFAPFVLIREISLTAANSLYLALSSALIISGCYQLMLALGSRGSRWRLWGGLAVLSTLSSASFISGLSIGQLSTAACGVMCWLVADQMRSNSLLSRRWIVAALIFLSLKPIYLAAGCAIMLGNRRKLDMALAAGCIALLLVLNTPFLGSQWPQHYGAALSTYSAAVPAPEYRGVFQLEESALLRAVFAAFTTQETLVWISSLLGVAGLSALLLGALREPVRRGGWSMACLGVYFATTPYVGTYEGILFLPALFQISVLFPSSVTWGALSTGVLAILCNYQAWDIPVSIPWGIFPVLLIVWIIMSRISRCDDNTTLK